MQFLACTNDRVELREAFFNLYSKYPIAYNQFYDFAKNALLPEYNVGSITTFNRIIHASYLDNNNITSPTYCQLQQTKVFKPTLITQKIIDALKNEFNNKTNYIYIDDNYNKSKIFIDCIFDLDQNIKHELINCKNYLLNSDFTEIRKKYKLNKKENKLYTFKEIDSLLQQNTPNILNIFLNSLYISPLNNIILYQLLRNDPVLKSKFNENENGTTLQISITFNTLDLKHLIDELL